VIRKKHLKYYINIPDFITTVKYEAICLLEAHLTSNGNFPLNIIALYPPNHVELYHVLPVNLNQFRWASKKSFKQFRHRQD